MMYYIESPSVDPYFNLALEQYVFDCLDPNNKYFMLWQNNNTIVVGKHQNTIEELNTTFVKENKINVVRRLSGGGAVYHDLGNLNFTFIVNENEYDYLDFAAFCDPIVKTLKRFEIEAEVNGRNDIIIDGKKFSGNSQYVKRKRIMHHGTILYDSNLDIVGKALSVSKDKIESKGLKSVKSRVTNVKSYMKQDIPLEEFKKVLLENMAENNEIVQYHLTNEDIEKIYKLKKEVYDTWEWNYGASPRYTIQKERRVEGCGKIEIHMNVNEGMIEDIAFYGDYFSYEDQEKIVELLKGQWYEESKIRELLLNVDIGMYFNNLDLDTFISIMME
ncbi:lipoate--protein ligase [Clostridiaceae bacterium 35-E11]